MSANDIEYTGIPLPRMGRMSTVTRPFSIAVQWADGLRAGMTETIDLSPIIDSFKIFRPLRNNETLFRTARLIDDGDAVAWSGTDIEMSAEAIEALAEQTMTPQDFVAFMERNDLTQEGAAAILGYSRRQIGYYTTTGPIPRVVALACLGYEAALRNFHFPTPQNTTVKVIYEMPPQTSFPKPKVALV